LWLAGGPSGLWVVRAGGWAGALSPKYALREFGRNGKIGIAWKIFGARHSD
jgi:hypothetical protein